MMARRFSSVSRRIACITLMILSMAASSGGASFARQADPGLTPEVTNLPVGVEMRYAADILLDGGDYEWQVVRSTTSLPGDEPITVHRGILIAPTGAVLVSHQDATLDLVEVGTGLLLEDGEAILPVSASVVAEDVIFAELLAVPTSTDATPTETPDTGTSPVTIAGGAYVVALVYVPASADAQTLADAVLARAVSPGLVIAETDPADGTPIAEDSARWIVALFTPDLAEAESDPSDSNAGNTSDPVPATPTSVDATHMPTATSTATSTPTPTPTATVTPTPTSIAPATATVEPTLPPITLENPTPTPGGLDTRSDVLEIDSAPSLVDLTTDTDADGLVDALEKDAGTNSNDKDSDDDGLEDGLEVDNRCNPLKSDTDDDGVSDDGEVLLFKTKCDDLDTDDDSLFDFDEIFVYYTDALLWDTDGDTLSDYEEVIDYNTGPRAPDSDGDGWRDDHELFVTGTNPQLRDGDYDCVMDSTEANYGTNPFAGDTDGDGQWDGQELTDGTAANDSGFYVIDPEEWEEKYGRAYVVGCDGTYVVW